MDEGSVSHDRRVDVLVLSPEDLIVHLCLHTAYKHHFTDLRHLYDIAETIRYYQGEMDWRQLQQRTGRWHARNCVYLTLHLAQKLLGAAVPDQVLQDLALQDLDANLVTSVEEQVFTNGNALNASSPSFKSLNLAQFWKARRIQDKAAILLKSLFPSPGMIARRYPVSPSSKRVYFYYLINLKDMILEHGPTVWRLWRRDAETVTLAEAKLAPVERKDALMTWLSSG